MGHATNKLLTAIRINVYFKTAASNSSYKISEFVLLFIELKSRKSIRFHLDFNRAFFFLISRQAEALTPAVRHNAVRDRGSSLIYILFSLNIYTFFFLLLVTILSGGYWSMQRAVII